ncbi:MAG TPA: winged helix-turn-helix domain-containing protein [Baekduia sp.]|nr:winged helix-turn-helix domain-containing protein [Baekduia sp.]
MPPVPERISVLLGHLRHPIRLPILLALEHRELSATELARELGEPFDAVNYALRHLSAAGLVELVRVEPASETANTLRRIYRTRRTGWARVVEVLDEFSADLSDDA